MHISSFIYFLMAILGFSILIIVHELGHFIVAKLNNVKIEEFSIGMGPKLFGISSKETDYSVRIIPFGGYVKMLGEQTEDIDDVNDPRAFSNKKPLQRLFITVAGPIMNILIAVLFFSIIASSKGINVPIISKVEKNSPAYIQNLKAGDEIIKINDKQIKNWDSFVSIINSNKDNVLNIQIKRDNKILNKSIKPMFIPEENRYIVGIYPTTKKINFLNGIKYGFNESTTLAKETFNFLAQLFQGKVSSDNVGGPVSVLRISTKAAQNGIYTLLWICAYISLQLAIFNLIPFPALDGGWIFLSIIEMIIGKKINDKVVNGLNFVGFVLLFTLMIIVTIKDILFPIKL